MPTVPSTDVSVPLLVGASKSYTGPAGEHVVFEGLNLSIESGRRLAIIAPNASGKSTLLRILLGIESLDAGYVNPLMSGPDRMAAVLQNYRDQLVPWADVETNLLIAMGRGKEPNPRRSEILSACREFFTEIGYNIDFRQRASALSGGQQQAVVLARALTFQSRILIWDEPTSALDVQRRISLHRHLLLHFRTEDPILVLVTHDVDEALVLAQEAVLFDANLAELRRVQMGSEAFVDLAAYRESEAYRAARAVLTGWA